MFALLEIIFTLLDMLFSLVEVLLYPWGRKKKDKKPDKQR